VEQSGLGLTWSTIPAFVLRCWGDNSNPGKTSIHFLHNRL